MAHGLMRIAQKRYGAKLARKRGLFLPSIFARLVLFRAHVGQHLHGFPLVAGCRRFKRRLLAARREALQRRVKSLAMAEAASPPISFPGTYGRAASLEASAASRFCTSPSRCRRRSLSPAARSSAPRCAFRIVLVVVPRSSLRSCRTRPQTTPNPPAATIKKRSLAESSAPGIDVHSVERNPCPPILPPAADDGWAQLSRACLR
jgi:hypothetical protein